MGLTRAVVSTGMLDMTPDCVKVIGLDGALLRMNLAGRRAWGLADDDPLGMSWVGLLPEESRDAGRRALDAARGGGTARFVGATGHGGQMRHWDNALMPIAGADGNPAAVLCVSREVTAAREAAEALRISEERLAIALRVGGMGVWDYDIAHDALACDEQWHRIMGRDPSRPVHTLADFEPFIHADDRSRATDVVRTAARLIATDDDYAIEFRIVRPDGEVRWLRSAARIEQEGDRAVRAVGFVIDITDARRGELALLDANRALEEERTALARQNLEDPLTGVANRRGLDRELARRCHMAGELGETLCVGMLDVDHFKAYNDLYGHGAGDDALRSLGHALQSVVRRADVVARYGGEEFVFVLSGSIDPAAVLDRLQAVVADLGITHAGSPVGRLTVSCGCVTVAGGRGLDPSALLRRSDQALYAAKAAGRDRYVVVHVEPGELAT